MRHVLAWSVLGSTLLACTASCALGEEPVPTSLIDGSTPPPLRVVLEGVAGPTVSTRVRVVRVAALDRRSAAAQCLRRRPRGAEVAGSAVERVGVSSESVTFRESSGRAVLGCDDSAGRREGGRRWCGGAHGTLVDGRLRDPRLDILCTGAAGEPMGFVWIEPAASTSYVAVRQQSFTEVYQVAAGLPVRMATTRGVDLERASATFDVSEHDRFGRLVRDYTVEASVAG